MIIDKPLPQLRIAVNSGCQKACFYCRPSGESIVEDLTAQLTSDEIVTVVSRIASYGIDAVKLTGGDPVLREDIVEVVRGIKSTPGIRTVELVTRHHRAGLLAADLADAGLDCLNFSLDTLDPAKFHKITGVNTHRLLIEAIEKSVPVSKTVKINTVVMAGVNSDELYDLVVFAETVGADTLKLLDLILELELDDDSFAYRLQSVVAGKSFVDLYYPLDAFAQHMEGVAVDASVSRQPGGLGHPMSSFRMSSGLRVQIKDARRGAWYGDICNGCSLYPCHDAIMALRLTPDGKLQRCLSRADNLLDLQTPLREGGSGYMLTDESGKSKLLACQTEERQNDPECHHA